MIRKFVLTLAISASSLTLPLPAIAQPAEATAVDPARLKLAEQVAAKLIAPGSYQKMMKDMADQMAGGMIEQMMGMDAAIIAKSAGESGKDVEGKSLGDIANEADPHFKERMDIMMKVMFDEMGKLMSAMEPSARAAMAKVYARKYDTRQLTDMNAFFATPSGSAFASDFLATFSDKEMISAMMGEMPKLLEAMPTIMKKVGEATAHLPPAPQTTVATEASAAFSEETDAPWNDPENWSAGERKKVEALEAQSAQASEKLDAIDVKLDEARTAAIESSKARYLAEGYKAPVPEPSPYDEEGLATLKKGWNKADLDVIEKMTVETRTAEEAASAASLKWTLQETLLFAAYQQAMVNAGQSSDGSKRPIAEAVEEARRSYDETNQPAGDAAEAAAKAVEAAGRAAAKAK
jgi:hypothetical protein